MSWELSTKGLITWENFRLGWKKPQLHEIFQSGLKLKSGVNPGRNLSVVFLVLPIHVFSLASIIFSARTWSFLVRLHGIFQSGQPGWNFLHVIVSSVFKYFGRPGWNFGQAEILHFINPLRQHNISQDEQWYGTIVLCKWTWDRRADWLQTELMENGTNDRVCLQWFEVKDLGDWSLRVSRTGDVLMTSNDETTTRCLLKKS